jgi:hypothetical protein
MAMILSSCASGKLHEAAQLQGQAQARLQLPDYPDDCRLREAHAALVDGAEIRSILKRERQALDRQNSRTDRCANFYDRLSEGVR